MSNTIYRATKAEGSRKGASASSRRFCVTLKEDTFLAFQRAADAAHHGLSGEAAEAIERDLKRAEALKAGRAT